MKKLALAATLATSFAAAPAIAQEATQADPFVATQGGGLASGGIVAAMAALLLLAAASGSSSGTD